MEYRTLGASGLSVSRLCLGAMMFGGQTDAAESRRIIDRAAEAGVNFLDTADVYNGGASEAVVGEAIAAKRDHWVLATKCGNTMGAGRNDHGLSRAWIFRAVEGSLRRLRTDRIEVLYLHREDAATPLATTVRALADLVRAGRIRHIGLSNFRAWRIAAFCALCDAEGIDRPVVSQPLYNALNRQVEREELPAAAAHGMAVFPYSPLARGLLTGKYHAGEPPPPDSRAGRQDRRLMEAEWRRESLAIAAELDRAAASRGTTTIGLAIAWVLANRLVTGAILGPRTVAQFESYLPALGFVCDAELEALIDRLVVPGHPSTPGFNDPQYPVEGRPR